MSTAALIDLAESLADRLREKALSLPEGAVSTAFLNESIACQSLTDRLKRLLPKQEGKPK